ncbi:hypothetical protein [Vibrio profundi]|uniref:hypothetical protein n=1 Tax=Vibrio profundi TaxID=1774960 RepID=UPI003736BF5F
MNDKLTLLKSRTPLASLLLTVAVLLTVLFSTSSFAMSMHQLVKGHHIEIESWLGDKDSPAADGEINAFSVNEKILLSIDIGSSRWFTSGFKMILAKSLCNILKRVSKHGWGVKTHCVP